MQKKHSNRSKRKASFQRMPGNGQQSSLQPSELQMPKPHSGAPSLQVLLTPAKVLLSSVTHVLLAPILAMRWTAMLYAKALYSVYSTGLYIATLPFLYGKSLLLHAKDSLTASLRAMTTSTRHSEETSQPCGSSESETALALVGQALWELGTDANNKATAAQAVTLKARIDDDPSTLKRIESTLFQLTDSIGTVRMEEDIYFRVPEGQLKLRRVEKKAVAPSEFSSLQNSRQQDTTRGGGRDAGELVTYRQTNCRSIPNYSEARVTPVNNGLQCLRRTLGLAMKELGTLVKKRRSYATTNFRASLDEVFGLGHFIDIDVHSRGQSEADLMRHARWLQSKLGLEDSQLVPYSYLELHMLELEKKQESKGHSADGIERLEIDLEEQVPTTESYLEQSKKYSSSTSCDSALGSNEDLASIGSIEVM